ncbi:hypothetical protein LBMAG56_50240 [Verrucomicrobiota bacterium]|nr:hypothetical protein LBMAG56_50240 [Verrucomicrobiota bacterium]
MSEIETTQPVRFTSLILEDDLHCAELISLAVQKEGGRAVVCHGIDRAREAIENRPFDLMILDQGLPDGTGSGFFLELREQGVHTPAIMLTGMPDLPNAVNLTRQGLFDYLAKPFDFLTFRECLRRAMQTLALREPEIKSSDFIGGSRAMREVQRLVQQAACHRGATVLLTGETGVGKDLTARLIHQLTFQSFKAVPPLISLNCSAVPAELFEAELFGAEKGAFTGATTTRNGLVGAAEGGTLFLDEIGEVSLLHQAKLLQLLETREYRRVGSANTLTFSGRIVTATNRDLAAEVERGRFREDLLYRLDVFSIRVPALRERREDLPVLCDHILTRLAEKYGRRKPNLKHEDFATLLIHEFPGNVRELRNLLERSLLQTPTEGNWLELDRTQFRKPRPVGAAGGPAFNSSRVTSVAPPPIAAPPTFASSAPTTPETSAAPLHETPPPVESRSAAPPVEGSRLIEMQEHDLIKRVLIEERGGVRKSAKKLGMTHQSLLRRLGKWPDLRAVMASFDPLQQALSSEPVTGN